MYRLGSGYIGSSELKTTTEANEQVIPNKPESWTMKYNCYRFSFMNDQQCSVLINSNTNPIMLRAGQGFTMSEIDSPIYSFKIVEAGITYNFIGAF